MEADTKPLTAATTAVDAPVETEANAASQMRRHFEYAVHQELEEHLDSPALIRRRIAQAVAMFGILAFIMVDFLAPQGAPRQVFQTQLDWKLIALMLPVVMLPVAYNYRFYRNAALTQYIMMGVFILGLAFASAVDIGRGSSAWLNYESLLLVTIYIYFISGLSMFRAVFCGLASWLAFTITQLTLAEAPSLRDEMIYLLAANGAGALGLLYLERAAQERFSDQYRLRVTAMLDFLTGVLNRGAIRSHIERTWRQACREDKTYALLIIDIDNFKSLNDRHGHHVGDACLAHVAEALSERARRPLDAVGRWGGDEFVAVWYDIDPARFSQVLKELPGAVSGFNDKPENAKLTVKPTLSGGAVLVRPDGDHDFGKVMEQADALLYKAKRIGRDQIITALAT